MVFQGDGNPDPRVEVRVCGDEARARLEARAREAIARVEASWNVIGMERVELV